MKIACFCLLFILFLMNSVCLWYYIYAYYLRVLFMKNFSANTIKYTVLIVMFLFVASCVPAFCNEHKKTLESADSSVTKLAMLFSNDKVAKFSWYPSYHLAVPGVTIQTPAAIAEFNGSYHLFYQYKVATKDGSKTVWAHSYSPDFLHWKNQKTALAPSENYDKDGILSGSAIVDDGLLYLIYTGVSQNKKDDKTEIHETQNLAMSKDGINFGKSANNSVIKMAPHYSYLEFSSQHFRNPYVWKLEDRYYALVGTQYTKTKDGAVLLFKSKDLRNWVCINVTALGQKGELGDLWEYPALIHIKGHDVLSISTKGIKPHGKMFLNKYQSGAFVGKLDYNTGKFAQTGAFKLFDYGFDFYAPQFITLPDGRHIYIGTLAMDGAAFPESSENWSGIMSLPRELRIVDEKLVSVPIKELETLRQEKISIPAQEISCEKEFQNIKGDVYEMILSADMTASKTFSVKLRTSASQETVLSYDKEAKVLKLNRDKSGAALLGEREAALPLVNNKLKLHIFVDNSSVEIFANDGSVVMSSRIYPDKNSVGIKFGSVGTTKLEQLDFYTLKSIYNK